MKKLIISLFAVLGLCGSSCSYLDMSPDLGIQEEDIFTSYNNTWQYFQTVYYREFSGHAAGSTVRYRNIFMAAPMIMDMNENRYSFYVFTDAADTGRKGGLSVKKGSFNTTFQQFFCNDAPKGRPLFQVMFEIIRICNKTIANVDRMADATPEQHDDLLGQAHFIRGFAYFTLCCYFGGMPYMTETLGADDEWDLPRLSAYETFVRCAEDFGTAYEYMKAAGTLRRDGLPGTEGNLTGEGTRYPNGVTAKAMQGRALLFAASKLNNRYGESDWRAAAEVCAEAITLAGEWGYSMEPIKNWSNNFTVGPRTNEQLWAMAHLGKSNGKNGRTSCLLAQPQNNHSKGAGTCPTQNYVDKFETKWGDPLETEDDRRAAVAAGHYDDQNPYANRDPRFDLTVVHDGMKVEGSAGSDVINIYRKQDGTYPTSKVSKNNRSFGWPRYTSTTAGHSNTGYYLRKYWDGKYNTSYLQIDPIIRVAELYLNYAEAVNEYAGPQGTAGGLALTALDAVNKVRERAGMPNVQERFTADRDTFRPRIYNERNVELAYEGHHYFRDSRRWRTCEQSMTQKLYGMDIELVGGKKKYTRFELEDARQPTWKPCMYYFPLPADEATKMKNFVNNDYWD